MLRVLRHLTRPASSLTRRNISSFIVLNNGKSLRRAAASRLVDIGYQTQTNDMSSSTSIPQLCGLNNYHAVGTRSRSILPLNNDCFELSTTSICHRVFSSADADLNQVRFIVLLCHEFVCVI